MSEAMGGKDLGPGTVMRIMFPFFVVLALTACSSGRESPLAVAVPDPLATVPGLKAERAGRAINALRRGRGLPPLVQDPRLDAAAAAHARDMRENGFFSHTGSDCASAGDRVRRAGYGYCFVAENLARGPARIERVLEGWMRSPGHRRNLLTVEARDFGFHQGPGGHWVLVLGRPGC